MPGEREGTARGGLWTRAGSLAAQAPARRNRYVDFLRAVSITVVVLGHWLMAAPYYAEGALQIGDLLRVVPWTRWLTWAFQVMPVFFMVGGYANAASWSSARRSGRTYAEWVAVRLRRLVAPLVLLLLFWTLLAAAGNQAGVQPVNIRVGSQAALIPVWFLSVYLLVVVAVPVTHRAWRRFGLASFWGLALGAVVVDLVGFTVFPLLRWVNYGFIWLAMHQLGYHWQAGGFATPARSLPWAALGLAVLAALVAVAGYPVSMVGVPGEEVSNSQPPTLALLALGLFHAGLLLGLQGPMRRWLERSGPWTFTVLVNGYIMTLYLWHLTAMVLVIGAANLLGGAGLGLFPGSGPWWATRPLWDLLLGLVLWPFLAVFARFEQGARGSAAAPLAPWRAVAGSILLCYGLASLARGGIGGDGPLGLRLWVVILALAGAALVLARRRPA